MKQKTVSNKALKHIICCFILLIIFVLTITKVNAQNESTLNVSGEQTEDVVPLRPQLNETLLELKRITIGETEIKLYDNPRIIEKDINYYIAQNEKELIFFSTMFGYNYDFIKQDIIKRSEGIENINETNIASLKNKNGELITYPTKEYGLVEYFYELVETNKKERTRKIESYSGNSDYVEKLIIYFSNIYQNVDTDIALSIGAAESGYYTVKYMLGKNNVYGGMSNSGLIRHDNIELGILSYVKMLSKNYFGKGLTTPASIGRVYCPTTNEYGNRIASPHWINLVNTAKMKYSAYDKNISIDDILNYIPSRISGMFVILSSLILKFNYKNSYKIMRRDARNCPSPNSGFTMATTAGALDIQLVKIDTYNLGDINKDIEINDIDKAVKLSKLTIFLFTFAIIILIIILYVIL